VLAPSKLPPVLPVAVRGAVGVRIAHS
jgi:hypothetical protein